MATEAPESGSAEAVPSLPEKIGPADLERLNEALGALFGELSFSRRFPPGKAHGRLSTVAALDAVWTFLMRFEPILAETLHVPLLHLHGALLALNENNVEPLLKPTAAPPGGRAPDTPARQQLIGSASGAVARLHWTGMARAATHKAVADILNKLGVRPGRDSARITARTVRGWCERVAADVGGHSIAATNANMMLTPKWQSKIKALPPTARRQFVLDALAHAVRNLANGGAAPAEKPSNPPLSRAAHAALRRKVCSGQSPAVATRHPSR
jgi:hypothetical protein